jgi:hypothetical protein
MLYVIILLERQQSSLVMTRPHDGVRKVKFSHTPSIISTVVNCFLQYRVRQTDVGVGSTSVYLNIEAPEKN